MNRPEQHDLGLVRRARVAYPKRRNFLQAALNFSMGAGLTPAVLALSGCGGKESAADAIFGSSGRISASELGTPLVPANFSGFPAVNTSTVFQHGVASGDPTGDGVILWTRISAATPGETPVLWEIFADKQLQQVLESGLVMTGSDRDYTVKIDLAGRLKPATTYFYRFTTAGFVSPTGRTRTLPAGKDAAQFRMAVLTCSNLPVQSGGVDGKNGTFAVLKALSERNDIDLVLHVGDYIYENGSDRYEPKNECKTTDDYRRRYAQARRDPSLQLAHQMFPWLCMWDDHEVANEPWATGAEFHNEAKDGSWQARKDRATSVFWEWMPQRQPDPLFPDEGWRRIEVGDLADLMILDARLHRSRWISEERDVPVPFFTAGLTEANDPKRTILGVKQEQWLNRQLDASKNRKAHWRIFSTGIPIIPWKLPGLPTLPSSVKTSLETFLDIPLTDGGNAASLDKWDGYTAARSRFLDSIRSRNLNDNLAVSGDLHFVLSGEISEDPFNPAVYDPVTSRGSVLCEMVTPAVSSGSFDEALAQAPEPLRSQIINALETGSTSVNPHHRFTEFSDYGYLLVDVTRERIKGEFHFLPGDQRFKAGAVPALRTVLTQQHSTASSPPLSGTVLNNGNRLMRDLMATASPLMRKPDERP